MGRGNATAAVVMLLLVLFQCGESYVIYRVGEDAGWNDKVGSAENYTNWASGKTFTVGDLLVFVYESNHTVVQTNNLDAYLSCNSSTDDAQFWSKNGSATSANVMLDAVGKTYFLCSAYDGSHCRAGMKFEINVEGVVTPASAPSQDLRAGRARGAGAAGAARAPNSAAVSSLVSCSKFSRLLLCLFTILVFH